MASSAAVKRPREDASASDDARAVHKRARSANSVSAAAAQTEVDRLNAELAAALQAKDHERLPALLVELNAATAAARATTAEALATVEADNEAISAEREAALAAALSEKEAALAAALSEKEAAIAAALSEKEAAIAAALSEKEAAIAEKEAALAAAAETEAAIATVKAEKDTILAVLADPAATADPDAAARLVYARLRATAQDRAFALAASAFAKRSGWSALWVQNAEMEDIYRCCRPVHCTPVPPALASCAFRAFYAELDSDAPVEPQLVDAMARLAAVATAALETNEKEEHRAARLRSVMNESLASLNAQLLAVNIMSNGKTASTDGTLFVGSNNAARVNMELRTFFGTGADPYMQNVQYGVHLWQHNGCPNSFRMFLITFTGDSFRVEAFWVDHVPAGIVVCCAPLTPAIPLGTHRWERRPFMGVMGAARVLRAVRVGVESIVKDDVSRRAVPRSTPCIDVPIWASPTQRLMLTKRLHDRLVYEAREVPTAPSATAAAASDAQRTYIVKFVQQYGTEAHQRACFFGVAPQLYSVQSIDESGGWQYVVMEHMSAEDGWVLLDSVEDEPSRVAAIDVLRRALSQYYNGFVPQRGADDAEDAKPRSAAGMVSGWVHGDLHQLNIMVKLPMKGAADDAVRVVLLDFDWAGLEGTVRYPYGMNHAHLRWGEGVEDGALITHEHDVFLIDRALAGKGDLIPAPPSPAEL